MKMCSMCFDVIDITIVLISCSSYAENPVFLTYLLCEKEQGVQEVLVYMHACGWSGALWCFPLPWGEVPQCHCCPYSVAEQGGPGGGAECSTVKRGRSACWHLPSPIAAGREKICFSICLCSLQLFPSPTAPPVLFCTPFLSPVSTRWLPEHCLPWVTVPDADCVHRHPRSAQLVS